MSQPLLLQYFQLIPEGALEGSYGKDASPLAKHLAKFRRAVEARYLEGTLDKLLSYPQGDVRRAALVALGLIGTMRSNDAVARFLHDDDPHLVHAAEEALYQIWFRGDSPENCAELQRIVQEAGESGDSQRSLDELDALIQKAPRFAEAYNQRGALLFKMSKFPRAAADFQKAVRYNARHYGAAHGMAQCFMRQRKLRAALRVYRQARKIHPRLEGVDDVIQSLEKMLGE